LHAELEWMTEMTEDEYDALTPRTRHDVDHIRLQLNKERLRRSTHSQTHISSCCLSRVLIV